MRSGKTPGGDGKMKKKPKHKKKPITPHVPDTFLDMYSPQDFLMKDFDKDNFITKTKQSEDGPGPSGGDVDFKYLAQLIHKMEPNDTKKNDDTKLDMLTPFRRTLNQLQGTGSYRPTKIDEYQTRRNFNTHDRNLERHDDLYYTKLGQQIASLIRNIDGTNGRRPEQISNIISNLGIGLPKRGPSLSNQDINQGSSLLLQDPSAGPNQNPYLYNGKKSTPLPQPIIYDNYGTRSYWERSVRSLFNNFHHDPEAIDPKVDNLYNLENRLITVASTERPLSLTELENILTVMAKAKTQLQKNTNDMLSKENGNENLNVNLLPQHMKIPAQNEYTFHRYTKTDTNLIIKEIHKNSEAVDEDEVKNLIFSPNKKKVTDSKTSSNRNALPNNNTTYTLIRLSTAKKLAKVNMTTNKKPLKYVSKTNKKKVVKKIINVSPINKAQTNLNLSNSAVNFNKTNLKTITNELMDFDMVPSKKVLPIFNLLPNLKETVKISPFKTNTLISNANKDKQQLVARSMINNVRRNLQGVLLHNFKNIPTLITNIPKGNEMKFKNNSHINVQDILKLQRLTTNKLQEITNAHNHLPKVTWITPKVAQFITHPDRPLLQTSEAKQAYRKTSIFPSNRPVFIEKPVRFQLPTNKQVFRTRPQSYFQPGGKGGSYFSHHINIYE